MAGRRASRTGQRDRLAAILSCQRRISDGPDAQAYPPDLESLRTALPADAPLTRDHRGPAFFFPDQVPTSGRAELLTDRSGAPREGPFAWLRGAEGGIAPDRDRAGCPWGGGVGLLLGPLDPGGGGGGRQEPADRPYGQREYSARDPEGGRWYFATRPGPVLSQS